MKHRMPHFLLAAALAAAAGAAQAQGDEASIEQRLADAQRRLEDAAREVAELSGQAGGEGFRQFEYFVPGHRRAVLGRSSPPGSLERPSRPPLSSLGARTPS